MGVPRAPDEGEVGQEMKKVHMEIFREYYGSLGKQKRKMSLFQGVFGGSEGGPQGTKRPKYGPLPWVRWVKKLKWFRWQF